ncbi:MAG: hypothetical protein L0177_06195 [Chloroflexi bacterium]|nr:hypothetical protein [Chloroflexota bacterium]
MLNQPLTDKRLAEMRERAEASSSDYWADESHRFWLQAKGDVLALVAEVERLKGLLEAAADCQDADCAAHH